MLTKFEWCSKLLHSILIKRIYGVCKMFDTCNCFYELFKITAVTTGS